MSYMQKMIYNINGSDSKHAILQFAMKCFEEEFILILESRCEE